MSNQTLTNPTFSSVIRERHSVRNYDSRVSISREELKRWSHFNAIDTRS